jgi:hypothetical protein
MTKKGSLNLSINAIVVLIMAITLLGLGLGFMKSMFASTTSQFEDINDDLKNTLINDIRNTGGRIVFDKEDISAKKGDSIDVYFGLRNDLGEDNTFEIMGSGRINNNDKPGKWEGSGSIIGCYDSVADGAVVSGQNKETDDIVFETITKKYLEDGEIDVKKLVIKVRSKAKSSVYQCSMIIEDPSNRGSMYDRKDFLITVQG